MRRIAAALALVAMSHSVVLRTGVLCDVPGGPVAASSAMPGMDMGGESSPDHSDEHGTDRHHGDAHCPLMATCSSAAVISVPIDVGVLVRAARSAISVRIDAPRSDRIAPEPPPPKN
jgi:hypothetical protein